MPVSAGRACSSVHVSSPHVSTPSVSTARAVSIPRATIPVTPKVSSFTSTNHFTPDMHWNSNPMLTVMLLSSFNHNNNIQTTSTQAEVSSNSDFKSDDNTIGLCIAIFIIIVVCIGAYSISKT